MSNVITLYDIISAVENVPWSPSTWRARYVLNIKNIPYKTVWVEFADIQTFSKKLGAAPTTKRRDGSDKYTFPIIHDPTTGQFISDSVNIADYLEKKYPTTRTVFPESARDVQATVDEALDKITPALAHLLLPITPATLSPKSREFFQNSWERVFGKKFEDFAPLGTPLRAQFWNQAKEGFDTLNSWSESHGQDQQPYFSGDVISYADIGLASYLGWAKLALGKDSEEWKELASWNGGRWAKVLDSLQSSEEYSKIRL